MSRSGLSETPIDQSEGRRRIAKACDRCRIKKVKCDGNVPCPRCKEDDSVCLYSAQRKSVDRPVSSNYVEQLELQQKVLIKTLKETWQRYGPNTMDGSQEPTVHQMAEMTGAIDDPSGQQLLNNDFTFDERLHEGRKRESTSGEGEVPRHSTSKEQPAQLKSSRPDDLRVTSAASTQNLLSFASPPPKQSEISLPKRDSHYDAPSNKLKRKHAPTHLPMPEPLFNHPPIQPDTMPQAQEEIVDGKLNDPRMAVGEGLSDISMGAANLSMPQQSFDMGGNDWIQWVHDTHMATPD